MKDIPPQSEQGKADVRFFSAVTKVILFPFSYFHIFLCDFLKLRELTTSAASFARSWLDRAKEAARQGGKQLFIS